MIILVFFSTAASVVDGAQFTTCDPVSHSLDIVDRTFDEPITIGTTGATLADCQITIRNVVAHSVEVLSVVTNSNFTVDGLELNGVGSTLANRAASGDTFVSVFDLAASVTVGSLSVNNLRCGGLTESSGVLAKQNIVELFCIRISGDLFADRLELRQVSMQHGTDGALALDTTRLVAFTTHGVVKIEEFVADDLTMQASFRYHVHQRSQPRLSLIVLKFGDALGDNVRGRFTFGSMDMRRLRLALHDTTTEPDVPLRLSCIEIATNTFDVSRNMSLQSAELSAVNIGDSERVSVRILIVGGGVTISVGSDVVVSSTITQLSTVRSRVFLRARLMETSSPWTVAGPIIFAGNSINCFDVQTSGVHIVADLVAVFAPLTAAALIFERNAVSVDAAVAGAVQEPHVSTSSFQFTLLVQQVAPTAATMDIPVTIEDCAVQVTRCSLVLATANSLFNVMLVLNSFSSANSGAPLVASNLLVRNSSVAVDAVRVVPNSNAENRCVVQMRATAVGGNGATFDIKDTLNISGVRVRVTDITFDVGTRNGIAPGSILQVTVYADTPAVALLTPTLPRLNIVQIQNCSVILSGISLSPSAAPAEIAGAPIPQIQASLVSLIALDAACEPQLFSVEHSSVLVDGVIMDSVFIASIWSFTPFSFLNNAVFNDKKYRVSPTALLEMRHVNLTVTAATLSESAGASASTYFATRLLRILDPQFTGVHDISLAENLTVSFSRSSSRSSVASVVAVLFGNIINTSEIFRGGELRIRAVSVLIDAADAPLGLYCALLTASVSIELSGGGTLLLAQNTIHIKRSHFATYLDVLGVDLDPNRQLRLLGSGLLNVSGNSIAVRGVDANTGMFNLVFLRCGSDSRIEGTSSSSSNSDGALSLLFSGNAVQVKDAAADSSTIMVAHLWHLGAYSSAVSSDTQDSSAPPSSLLDIVYTENNISLLRVHADSALSSHGIAVFGQLTRALLSFSLVLQSSSVFISESSRVTLARIAGIFGRPAVASRATVTATNCFINVSSTAFAPGNVLVLHMIGFGSTENNASAKIDISSSSIFIDPARATAHTSTDALRISVFWLDERTVRGSSAPLEITAQSLTTQIRSMRLTGRAAAAAAAAGGGGNVAPMQLQVYIVSLLGVTTMVRTLALLNSSAHISNTVWPGGEVFFRGVRLMESSAEYVLLRNVALIANRGIDADSIFASILMLWQEGYAVAAEVDNCEVAVADMGSVLLVMSVTVLGVSEGSSVGRASITHNSVSLNAADNNDVLVPRGEMWISVVSLWNAFTAQKTLPFSSSPSCNVSECTVAVIGVVSIRAVVDIILVDADQRLDASVRVAVSNCVVSGSALSADEFDLVGVLVLTPAESLSVTLENVTIAALGAVAAGASGAVARVSHVGLVRVNKTATGVDSILIRSCRCTIPEDVPFCSFTVAHLVRLPTEQLSISDVVVDIAVPSQQQQQQQQQRSLAHCPAGEGATAQLVALGIASQEQQHPPLRIDVNNSSLSVFAATRSVRNLIDVAAVVLLSASRSGVIGALRNITVTGGSLLLTEESRDADGDSANSLFFDGQLTFESCRQTNAATSAPAATFPVMAARGAGGGGGATGRFLLDAARLIFRNNSGDVSALLSAAAAGTEGGGGEDVQEKTNWGGTLLELDCNRWAPRIERDFIVGRRGRDSNLIISRSARCGPLGTTSKSKSRSLERTAASSTSSISESLSEGGKRGGGTRTETAASATASPSASVAETATPTAILSRTDSLPTETATQHLPAAAQTLPMSLAAGSAASFAGSVILGGGSGLASAFFSGHVLLSLQAFRRCPLDEHMLELPPLTWSSNPTTLEISRDDGDGRHAATEHALATMRGALVGNLLVWLAFFLFRLVELLHMFGGHPVGRMPGRTNRRGHRRAGTAEDSGLAAAAARCFFPGNVAVVFIVLMPMSAYPAGTLAKVASVGGKGEQWFAALGLGLWVVAPMLGLAWLVNGKVAAEKLVSLSARRLRRMQEPLRCGWEWKQWAAVLDHFNDPVSMKWDDRSWTLPIWSDVFDSYGKRPYIIIDYAFPLAAVAICGAAVACGSQMCCNVMSILVVVLSLAHCVVLFFVFGVSRALLCRLDRYGCGALSVLVLAGSIAAVVSTFSERLLDGMSDLNLVLAWVANALCYIMMLFVLQPQMERAWRMAKRHWRKGRTETTAATATDSRQRRRRQQEGQGRRQDGDDEDEEEEQDEFEEVPISHFFEPEEEMTGMMRTHSNDNNHEEDDDGPMAMALLHPAAFSTAPQRTQETATPSRRNVIVVADAGAEGEEREREAEQEEEEEEEEIPISHFWQEDDDAEQEEEHDEELHITHFSQGAYSATAAGEEVAAAASDGMHSEHFDDDGEAIQMEEYAGAELERLLRSDQ